MFIHKKSLNLTAKAMRLSRKPSITNGEKNEVELKNKIEENAIVDTKKVKNRRKNTTEVSANENNEEKNNNNYEC